MKIEIKTAKEILEEILLQPQYQPRKESVSGWDKLLEQALPKLEQFYKEIANLLSSTFGPPENWLALPAG